MMEAADRSETGRRGERVALEYLLQRGYILLEKNWRCRHLEVDLILLKDGVLHFVEVRSRTEPVAVDPAETLDRKKMARIFSAAKSFVAGYRKDAEVSFDAVSVVFSENGCHVEFFPDAFIPIM